MFFSAAVWLGFICKGILLYFNIINLWAFQIVIWAKSFWTWAKSACTWSSISLYLELNSLYIGAQSALYLSSELMSWPILDLYPLGRMILRPDLLILGLASVVSSATLTNVHFSFIMLGRLCSPKEKVSEEWKNCFFVLQVYTLIKALVNSKIYVVTLQGPSLFWLNLEIVVATVCTVLYIAEKKN